MSDPNRRILEKDLDYAVVYADGVITQLGGDVSRLIFYQEVLEPTEDGGEIDKAKKIIRLKFEVRMPYSQLWTFVAHAKKSLDVLDRLEQIDHERALFKSPEKTDEELAERLASLRARVGQALSDSGYHYHPTNKALEPT